MQFKTYSDMGSIRIYTPDVSFFFANGYGDGENIVEVTLKQQEHTTKAFSGHFSVITEAHLAENDCEPSMVCANDPERSLYAFGRGRWFVYLDKPGVFVIEYTDDNITG